MDKYTTYVGMDVHARSITAKTLNKITGETTSKRFGCGYSALDIASWCATLEGPVYLAYESGCTGVSLARNLRALGLMCDVIAISTLPRSTKDKQSKCDKLDARAILREIANPMSTYSCVWIATEEQEGLRDLSRAHMQIAQDLKRARQQLRSFLMHKGFVFNELTKTGRPKSSTGKAYEAWLNTIEFSDRPTQLTFESYRRKIASIVEEKKRLAHEINMLAITPENKPFTDALCGVKGINVLSAMLIKAEIASFARFTSGRKISSWAGIVPKENSSGDKQVKGSITKSGNKYVRRALLEGIGTISVWKHSLKPEPKDCSAPESAMRIARAANERILEKYHHLHIENGINSNKAKVAVANELIRWIWVIGLEVENSI